MKKMKYLAALLVCAGIANAAIITPTGVTDTGTFDATGDAGSSLGALIDGSGLSGMPVDDGTTAGGITHAGDNGDIEAKWVTTSAGGDFFIIVTNETVQLDFDLGGANDIQSAYIWGYYYWGWGNSATSIDVSYSTNGTTFGNTDNITLGSPTTGALPVQVVDLTSAPAGTTHVRFLFLANGGDDRVGLGEVLFGETSSQPLPPTITSFTATPSSVTNGGTTTLEWTTTDADTATIDQSIGSVPVLGSTQVVVSAETTYTLTASGVGGTTNQSVTVTITLPPEPITGTIIQPASITGNLEGDAGSSIADLTSGSGLSASLTNGTDVTTAQSTTHVLTGTGHEDSWTLSTGDGIPVFSMDLGSEQVLDAAVLWQYGNNGGGGVWDSGNHTRQFELIFHTAAEGPTFDFDSEAAEFSGTMAYIDEGGEDSTASNLAQIFSFPVETAQYVGLRIVSNWGGEAVDGNTVTGGDRFGLGEIRFASGTTFVADPIGNITISGPVAISGGQGMLLSWDTSDGQEYNVQSKSNLITEPTWTTITNVTGTGGGITVTTAVDNAEAFYQVMTPAP